MTGAESVSAIITAFNCERYVGEAIESVLAQSRPPNEVIVVDDGSRDETAAAIRSFGERVKLIQQENRGIGSARNLGLSASAGDWIAFLDGDDVWTPEKTALQLAQSRSTPDALLVSGNAENFVSPESIPTEAARWRAAVGAHPGWVAGSILARRSAFELVGRFREDVKFGEFIDWIKRARDLGVPAVAIDRVVLRRRIHGGNHTLLQKSARADYARVVKASLDRGRRGSGA